MKPRSKREEQLAFRIKELTGKKLRTCVFCLRFHHGNYKKALEMCSQSSDTSEGERSSYYPLALAA